MEILCFGCIGEPGHYLRSKRRGHIRDRSATPWTLGELDGSLLHAAGVKDIPDGTSVVSKKDGWTAVSFWDRSGDSRGASNTSFLVAADISGEELITSAREQWPQLFARPGFPDIKIPVSQSA